MTHANLISKLEGLSGPDREVGREVLLACGWRKTFVGHFYGPMHLWSPSGAGRSYDEDVLPCPTASIDAAIGLIEEKQGEIGTTAADLLHEAINDMLTNGWRPDRPQAPQIARAALIALLRALETEGSEA